MAPPAIQTSNLFTVVLGCLHIVWSFLKLYIFGAYALLLQICQGHRKPGDISLQTGKVAIVTGGSNGIGFQVSKGLVAKNIHVVIASKCEDQGRKAVADIREEFPNAKVDFMELNLTSLSSVREFTQQFLSRNLPLHLLINNAGVMFTPYHETEDGFEEHFQVNYLSHFLLTHLLLDKLKESGEDNSYSRIVNVSSVVHHLGSDHIDSMSKRYPDWWEYSPHAAYANSKAAVVIATSFLDQRLRGDNSKVLANAVHPGVVKTDLYRHVHPFIKWLLDIIAVLCYKTPSQGADTILYAALSPQVEGQSGCYYDNCKKSQSWALLFSMEQEELWSKSCELTNISLTSTSL